VDSIPISISKADEVWELVKGKTISEVDPRGWGEPEIKFEDGSRLLILPVFVEGIGDEGVEVVLEQPSDLFNVVRENLAELVESKAVVQVWQEQVWYGGFSTMLGSGTISWYHGWYRVDSIGTYYFRLEDVEFTRAETPTSWSIHLSKDCNPTTGGYC